GVAFRRGGYGKQTASSRPGSRREPGPALVCASALWQDRLRRELFVLLDKLALYPLSDGKIFRPCEVLFHMSKKVVLRILHALMSSHQMDLLHSFPLRLDVYDAWSSR
ncbi:Protein of unknown function, partial [Gryllus bimaculatus]